MLFDAALHTVFLRLGMTDAGTRTEAVLVLTLAFWIAVLERQEAMWL